MTEIMVANPPGKHSANRLFEWVMAGMMLTMALLLAWPGESMSLGTLRGMARIGFTEPVLTGYFAVVGSFRAVALWANGDMHPQGPIIRTIGAILGAIVWLQFALILLGESVAAGIPIFGLAIFVPLAGGEFFSCYRATMDQGRRRGITS